MTTHQPPPAELPDQERAATVASQRIAAVLADLEHVPPYYEELHDHLCWQLHVECLAARIRRTLTEEVRGG
jgi:hypothetical protein